MSTNPTDLNAMHRALFARHDQLTNWLGITGKRVGNTWKGGENGSRITIKLTGDKAGAWGAWSAGVTHHNLIGLIAYKKGIKFGPAISEARAFLGDTRPDDNRRHEQPQANPRAGTDRAIDRARCIAARSRGLHGTSAEQYLTEARAIPRPAAGWPTSIAFDPVDGALMATITDEAGAVVAVHRVFVTPAGEKIDADQVRNRRLMAVKRTDGPRGLGLLRLGDIGIGPLCVAEGLETGLAIHVATGHDVVVTLGSMAQARHLPAGRPLISCLDDDPPDSKSLRTTLAWCASLAAEGSDVSVVCPWPERRGDKSDLADVIRQLGPRAVAARIEAADPVTRPAAPAPLKAPYPLPTASIGEARAVLEGHTRGFFNARVGHNASHLLNDADGGIGKTEGIVFHYPAAMLCALREKRPHRLIHMVPEHGNFGQQLLQRYLAVGVNAVIHRGRGEENCVNYEAVRLAERSSVSAEQAVCKSGDKLCPNFGGCGFQGGLPKAALADVVIIANNYLFERLPKAIYQNVGWIAADEALGDRGDLIRCITFESFGPEALARFSALVKQTPDQEGSLLLRLSSQKLLAASENLPDGYHSAGRLRAAGLTAAEADASEKLGWRRQVDADMSPVMTLEARREEAKRCGINSSLPSYCAVWRAVSATLRDGEAAAGRLEVRTRDTKRGVVREFIVNEQRPVAPWLAEIPIMMLAARGKTEQVRGFFPDTVLCETPRVAAPHAHIRLITGNFGKVAMVRSPYKRKKIRALSILRAAGGPIGLVTHKSVVGHFEDMPATTVRWHGATAGDDGLKNVALMVVTAGRWLPSGALASLAAARSGQAVPALPPERKTKVLPMMDGTVRGEETLAYADPRLQAVHEQTYLADIHQGALRARPFGRTADKPVMIDVYGRDPPDMPLSEIVAFNDLQYDRLTEMLARAVSQPSEFVALNAAHMHLFHPDLFSNEGSAADAREEFGDFWARVMAVGKTLPFPLSRVRLQPVGQGHKLSWIACPTKWLDAARQKAEAELGALAHWQPELLTEGRGETADLAEPRMFSPPLDAMSPACTVPDGENRSSPPGLKEDIRGTVFPSEFAKPRMSSPPLDTDPPAWMVPRAENWPHAGRDQYEQIGVAPDG